MSQVCSPVLCTSNHFLYILTTYINYINVNTLNLINVFPLHLSQKHVEMTLLYIDSLTWLLNLLYTRETKAYGGILRKIFKMFRWNYHTTTHMCPLTYTTQAYWWSRGKPDHQCTQNPIPSLSNTLQQLGYFMR